MANRSLTSPTSPAATAALAALRAGFAGRIIAPDDAEYDQARAVFYAHIDRHPAAVVRPTGPVDIARVITVARDHDLELAVRGGGHSIAGHSVTDGGFVLDLSGLKQLDIDPQSRTAWAEAGLTAGEYTTAAGAYGLATGFGDTAAVGIGGLALGGGIGYLVRKHGLTIDNLLAAEIVTADGRALHVDADSHPDLFWAIRGGGGNFGVVSRFHFQLHELPSVVGGMLMLPATPDVLAGFIAASAGAPDELSAIGNVFKAPPMPFLPPEAHGQLVMMVLLVYAGDADAGRRAVAPFRALAAPYTDMIRPMSYAEMYQFTEGGPGETPSEEVARSGFMETLDADLAETLLDQLQASTAIMAVAQFRALGGAMARVPVEATAFAHRRRPILVTATALFDRAEETAAHERWITALMGSARQGEPGVYVNFLGEEGLARVRDAYPGPTWERLAAVKARYDPTNFFRHNHNVPPAVT